MSISVIICTHNPRPEYLAQVLGALKVQTLPFDRWELVLIDNGSSRALSGSVDLSWHPHARLVREEELGLTSARLRGIQESTADLITFVDDDNVLEPDYLEVARDIGAKWPVLGAWGGQVKPKFEHTPPAWAIPYLGMLALREFTTDKWGNVPHAGIEPCGAGMCVRRSVAAAYAARTRDSDLKKGLDRRGSSLVSAGDTDLAWTACDLGLGMGLFEKLKLMHLIPAGRLSEDYLVRLQEAHAYSGVLLDFIRWNAVPRMPYLEFLFRAALQFRKGIKAWRIWHASQKGRFRAVREIKVLASNRDSPQVDEHTPGHGKVVDRQTRLSLRIRLR